MKSTILFFTAALIGFTGTSQEVNIYTEGTTNDISGTMVDGSGSDNEMSYYLNFENTSGVDKEYTLKRKKLQVESGVGDYVCWGADLLSGQCYPEDLVTPDDPFVSPDAYTIAAGRTGIIYSYHVPNGVSGEIIYRYYVYTGGVPVDSIDVRYNYALSAESVNPAKFSVYPNPANDFVVVSAENILNNASISIFDITGKTIQTSVLVNGKTQLDISNLNAGIYFYAIRNDKDILETKKLVVL